VRVTATWSGARSSFVAVEARFTPLLRDHPIAGPLVAVGDACAADAPGLDAVAGRVALVDAGGCPEDRKVANVQQRGGSAALVASAGAAQPMYGSLPVDIPALSVSASDAEMLRQRLALGPVDVAASAADDIAADSISGSSARGPSRNGGIKPDLAAPGANIISAGYASGDASMTSTGTSMAAPHVAGAVALLWQRNRVERLGLGALDLAALLMNNAMPAVWTPVGENRVNVPIARRGAGRVDALAAGTAGVLVRAGPIASADFGHVALRRRQALTLPLTVRNLGDAALRFRQELVFRHGPTGDPGVAPIDAGLFTVPGRGERVVAFGLDVAPGRLRPWALRERQSTTSPALSALEVDGDVYLRPVDETGADVPGAAAPHLPFYLLPRAAASAWAERAVWPAASAPGQLVVANRPAGGDDDAALPGRVELFALPRGAAQPDPDDASLELDLWHVGARFDAAGGSLPDRLTFGVALRRPAVLPQRTSYELYLDTDRDGRSDWRIRSLTENRLVSGGLEDKVVVTVTPWAGAAGAPAGEERSVGPLTAELHGRTALLTVPIAALGAAVPPSFDFYLVHRGLGEDWPAGQDTDVAPDGAEAPGGPRYRFDATQTGLWPVPAAFELAPGEEREVTLGAGEAAPGLLAFYPDNERDPTGSQVQVLRAGAPPPAAPWAPAGPPLVYLPLVTKLR
jgi:hypothetical protein